MLFLQVLSPCSARLRALQELCGDPGLPGLPRLRTPLFLLCVLGEHELRWWGPVAARAPVWTSSLREPISLSLIPAAPQCATQGLKEVGGRKKKPKGGSVWDQCSLTVFSLKP